MSISKRGKSWQVSVTCQGRRVRRSFKSHDDARQFELEAMADLMAGREPRTHSTSGYPQIGIPTTFGSLTDRVWSLEWSKQKSADHTFNRMMQVINYFGDKTEVKSITSSDLESYVLHLRHIGNGPSTINRKLAIISKVMQYALRHELITTKPYVALQREPEGRVKYYTEEEEIELLAVLPEELRDLFVVLIDTGMRRGEALSLEWVDVDYDKNQISLSDPSKIKTSMPRTIPMTTRVREIFRSKSGYTPFDLTSSKVDYMVKNFKYEHDYGEGLEALFHTCRHTFCSRLISRGVPLATVRVLAGHKDIKTTLRYAHLAPSSLHEAVAVLEEARPITLSSSPSSGSRGGQKTITLSSSPSKIFSPSEIFRKNNPLCPKEKTTNQN